MTVIYDKTAKKEVANIDSILKKSVEELVKDKEVTEWEKKNQEAIYEYNKRVAKNGLFSDDLRSF
ncbi:MAG: type II toxin-antitoxin system CcdA family antitoxin [Arcobacteraceae bacterium]